MLVSTCVSAFVVSVCVILLVLTVVVFDEVLQQVNSPLRLYLIDLNEILRQKTGSGF